MAWTGRRLPLLLCAENKPSQFLFQLGGRPCFSLYTYCMRFPVHTFVSVFIYYIYISVSGWLTVPVAERSKARVYGRSLAGIAGSNPAGGMDGCPL